MHRLMTPPSQFRDVFLPLKAQLQPVGAPFWSDPQKSVILQQQATFKGVACAIFTLERRSKGASGKSPLRQLWNRVPGGVPMGLMGTKSTQKRSWISGLFLRQKVRPEGNHSHGLQLRCCRLQAASFRGCSAVRARAQVHRFCFCGASPEGEMQDSLAREFHAPAPFQRHFLLQNNRLLRVAPKWSSHGLMLRFWGPPNTPKITGWSHKSTARNR